MAKSSPAHALLINTFSGMGINAVEVDALFELCKQTLVDIELYAPSHATGMKQICESLIDAGCNSFVVVGGNGTINLVADCLISAQNTSTSICILDSFKSANDLSRSIWPNVNNKERLACLLEDKSLLIDTVLLEDSHHNSFIAVNGCSLGACVTLARNCRMLPQKWPRWLKYTLTIAKDFAKLWPFQTIKQGDAIATFISNSNYACDGMQVAPEADVSDGKLSITTIRASGVFRRFSNLIRMSLGPLHPSNAIEKMSVADLNITCKYNVPLEFDGKFSETKSINARCIPQSLRVVVPRSQIAVQ